MELIPIITRWKTEFYRRSGGTCYGWITADGDRLITFDSPEHATNALEEGHLSSTDYWMMRSDLSPDRELIPLEKNP